MFAFFAIFLISATSPARAQSPSGQLCEAVGSSAGCIDFSYRSSASNYARPERPERSCPECAARERAELAESLATMEHPSPVVPLSEDVVVILGEDVRAQNAAMEALDLALGTVLAAPALELALDAAATLLILNVVVSVAATAFPAYVRVPPWLNLLSLTRAAEAALGRTCEELLAAARAACASAATAMCGGSDDCRTLLEKRQSRLACDFAWQGVKDGKDASDRPCRAPSSDRESWTDNTREVADCGKMIADKPECCPPEAKTRQDEDCPRRLPTCGAEAALSEADLLALSPSARAEHCASLSSKRAAVEACRAARQGVVDRCFEGRPDAGHAKAIDLIGGRIPVCDEAASDARRVGICP